MPKQLNVNLAFTADTKQAKAQIDQLQHQLTELINIGGKGSSSFALTKEIQQATTAAAQLKAQIKGATDVDTGKLDLTKFTQSMTDSGMSLKKYQQQLSQLGPAGDRAFASLAASINNADARLKSANGILGQFATTLKNTARWQISSSILHGFMGSLQSAYGYAQDLNQSLNNIRIVTGASTDEMASFATQANKAAQALSTTTTSYTDAALIYYQQGIRDQEEIAGRTETTIKLANVSRQSAEEVSQQMTAIWNNFYDGSKSLEFYADAITALGATTASSSAEIAAGLEKFAAIADTVGLSYEYATAAMATITAQTRQSADTVGTGLRTLFSRLEGLKLGETLEDGVDLNKYSEALNKVGVQVMDATGQLRDMDDILDDLGARWDQLGRAEQTALAQTVGGVRQYTNLIALMDNWDKMKANVLTAQGAEGTLQEQADIYAESWEAAQKRVRAAWEEIYSSVFDDKFFINMTNGLAKFVNVIGDAVDGLGGMKGVLLLIGSIITKMFSQDLSNGIAKMTSGFQLAMMGGQKFVEQQRKEANELLMKSNINDGTLGGANIAATYQAQGNLQNAYLDAAQKLSAEQQTIAQQLLDQNRILGENAREQALVTKATEEEAAAAERLLNIRTKETQQTALKSGLDTNREKVQQLGAVNTADTKLYNIAKDIDFSKGVTKNEQALKQLEAELQTLHKGIQETGGSFESVFGKAAGSTLKQMLGSFKDGAVNIEQLEKAWSHWTSLMGETDNELEKIIQALTAMKTGLDPSKMDSWGEKQKSEWAQARTEIEGVVQGYQQVGNEAVKCAEKTGQVKIQAENTKQAFDEMAASVSQRIGQGITAATSAMMSFGMALSSIKSLGSIWSNEDISLGDKLISTMTSLGIIVPSLTAAFRAENIEKIKGLALDQESLASLFGLQAVKTAEGKIIWENVGAKTADTAATVAETAAETAEAGAATADTIAHAGLGKAIWGVVKARLASLSSMLPYLAALMAIVAVIGSIIAIVKILSSVYNADAIAAENAEAAARNLAEALNDTRQAYDDLKNSINDYHSAKDAISSLARGTQEWKDAIRDSNTEALKLIDSLGLIKDADYTIDKDGIIRIDEDVLNKAIEAKSQEVNKAQTRSLMADQTAKQARTEADITALKRSSGMGGQIDKALERLTSGDLADQFAKGLLDTAGLKDALGIEDSGIVEEIAALATAMRQNTDMQQMSAEQAAKTSLEGNKAVQQSGYADEMSKAAGNIYNQAYQDSYDKYLGVAEQNDYQTAKLFADYVKETGLDQKKGFQLEGTDKQGNQMYSYIDEETGKRTEAITVLDEEIAAIMAAADADQQLAEVSTGLISEFKSLDQVGDGASKALKDFLTEGNLASTKGKEFKDLQDKMGNQSAKDYLGATLGDGKDGLSNEEAQALGYESAQALISAFEEAIANAESDIAEAGQDMLSGSLKRMFNQLTEGADISAAGKEALAGQIAQAFEQGGYAGAKALTDFYSTIEPDKLEDVVQTMGDIDWSSISPSEFADKMAELGINVDAANPGVANFIDMMREASGLSFEGAVASFHQLNEIADKISAYGDTLSSEEYEALPAAAKEFFRENLDGEYELVGKAEDFKTMVEGIALNDAKQLYNQGVEQQNAMGYAMENDVTGSAISSGAGGQMSVDTEQLAVQVDLVQALGEASGMTAEQVAELCSQDWENIDPTNPEDVQLCQELANAVGQLDLSEESLKEQQLALAESNQELANKMAMSAQTEQDLNDLYEAGAISLDTYNDAYRTLSKIDGVDEDHVEEMKELGEYYAENADQIDGLSKSLKGNRQACQQVAKVLTRYREALEDANDNMDEWKKGLDKSKKGSNDYRKTVEGLRKAYGDLANKDGKKLSQSFVENAKNMDLLEKAMNGDVEAADELEDAINKDFLAQMGIDTTNFDADKEYVQSEAERLTGQDFDDIEIGAELNDENFLNALSEMVTAAGMTADQATEYLASMGIDAEVVEDDSTTTETNEMTGYDVETTPQPVEFSLPKVSGGTDGVPQLAGTDTATGHVDQVSITPQKETETSEKEQKSFGLKVTNAKRGVGSGGNFKHSNSGGGGNSGGCFVAGTLVSTNQGFCPIEQIQPGDIVLSYNEQNQINEYSKVINTMIHFIWTNLYLLHIGTEVIKVTGIHCFYIKRAGVAQWLPASELRAGDLMYLSSGEWQTIDHIKRKYLFRKVYNFEVENNHNYYVSKSQILAHNKGCFVAKTLITTNNGYKNIEDIQVGDIVLSYDETEQKNTYSIVAQTMTHFVYEKIYKLHIGNEILQVTGIHRFFIKRNNQISWIHAENLQEGDLVLYSNGTWNKIIKIESKIRFRKVYNFEVSNTHNYYVGQNQILAHNKGGRRRGGGGRRVEHMRAEKQEHKTRDEGKERYHVVTTQLEKINGQLTKISTAYDRAFGAEKLKLLDGQIAKQEELVKKQKKYVGEINDYAKKDAENLTKGIKTYWSETEGKFKEISANASKLSKFKVKSELDDSFYNKKKTTKKGKGKGKGKGTTKKLKDGKKSTKKRTTTKKGTKSGKGKLKSGKGGGKGGKRRRTTRRRVSKKKKSTSLKDFKTYLGIDIKMDKNGVITNYEKLIEKNNQAYNKAMDDIYAKEKSWVKKINDMRDKGKDTKKEEEKLEKWKAAALESAQAQYDAFLEFFQQYEETQALLMEQEQELIDKENELYDMKLEKATLTVQLKVDVAEDKLKLIENLFEQLGDSAYNAAKRIALMGQQLQAEQFKVDAYKQGINDIFENHGIKNGGKVLEDFFNGKVNADDLLNSMSTDGSGNHFTQAEADYFREAADAALAYNSQAIEMRSKVIEEIGNVMDDNTEKLDRITNKMEYLKDVANSYKNIVDLTGRSFLNISTEMYDAMEQTNVNLAKQSLNMANDRKAQAEAQYQYILREYASMEGQLSDAEKDGWKERIKAAEDAVQEQTQNFYSSWESAIEAVNTRFESMMTNMAEDFSKAMAGNIGNLEGLQERMSLRKDVADVYLPSYERIYQLTKLTNEAQKAIDSTNSIKVQKELEKVQQKILDAKKSGTELSKYDIEFMTKELELKKAQMALEEAQQVKSQVRMSRDSEGNYSYVYTADETKVQDAESEYNAKLYEMQKLNEEYINSLQEQLVGVEQSYISAIQGAAETYGKGTAEYDNAVIAINKEYQTYFDELNQQMNNALENQLTTQEEHARIYEELTGDLDQATAKVTTSWEDTTLASLTGFKSIEQYQDAWKTSTEEVMSTVTQANQDWKDDMAAVYEEAGTSISGFKDDTAKALVEVSVEAEKTGKAMDAMVKATDSALVDVTNAAIQWEQEYSAVIEANIQKNNEFVASVNDLLAAWSKVTGISSADALDAMTADNSLETARANLDRARKDYRRAREKTTRARRKMDSARRKVGRTLRRAERRVTDARRRVTKARKAVTKARRTVRTAQRKVNDAKRALRNARGRRARAAAKKKLTSAQRRLKTAQRTLRKKQRTLRTARRTLRTAEKRLRTAVRRASRRERRKWQTYQTARRRYTTARREQKAARANLDAMQKAYDEAKRIQDQKDELARLEEEKKQAEEERKKLEEALLAEQEKAKSAGTGQDLTSQVSSTVDANTQAFLNAMGQMTITPTVNVDLPKDLQQHVTFEKIDFPNITNKEELLQAFNDLLTIYSASQFTI